jgi:hypothetical protein
LGRWRRGLLLLLLLLCPPLNRDTIARRTSTLIEHRPEKREQQQREVGHHPPQRADPGAGRGAAALAAASGAAGGRGCADGGGRPGGSHEEHSLAFFLELEIPPVVVVLDQRPLDHQLLPRRLHAAELGESTLKVEWLASGVELDACEPPRAPSDVHEHQWVRQRVFLRRCAC